MTNSSFNEVIHAPNRLKICSFLSPASEVEFQLVRDMLQVSDSVLSKQIKHLEDAGYVKQRKGSANGRKRSWVYLTTSGRNAFDNHIRALQKIIGEALDT
jgi:DNA-binding MarR family transcriptional regulator